MTKKQIKTNHPKFCFCLRGSLKGAGGRCFGENSQIIPYKKLRAYLKTPTFLGGNQCQPLWYYHRHNSLVSGVAVVHLQQKRETSFVCLTLMTPHHLFARHARPHTKKNKTCSCCPKLMHFMSVHLNLVLNYWILWWQLLFQQIIFIVCRL